MSGLEKWAWSRHSRNQTWYPGPRLRRNLFSATQKKKAKSKEQDKEKKEKKEKEKEKEKDRSRRKTLNDIPSTTNKVVENEVARINSKINQNNAAHSSGFDIKKCLLERENEKLAKDNERLTKLVETLSAQISAQSAQIENLQLQMEKLVDSLSKPAPQSVETQDNPPNIDADSPKRKKAKKTNDCDKSMETDIDNSQPLEYQGPTKQIATTSSYTPPINSDVPTAPQPQLNQLNTASPKTDFPSLPPSSYSPPTQQDVINPVPATQAETPKQKEKIPPIVLRQKKRLYSQPNRAHKPRPPFLDHSLVSQSVHLVH
ncbi:unnamed protein product [Brassicogethes aeneus]|uniref:Uncharacterized protein n=1 Tax=Brassicogethes aeneus TaxID=1431903 RepID=A0A9P0FJ32_BRAAE|nr:unnamed protein product [Brassicogethes aeneus]